VVVEIPGTGDSPAAPNDPESPDRQWSSVLDWIDAQPIFNRDELIAWGLSTGGYYAYRIAHTHAERLKGVVSQGGGAHRMFEREWIERSDLLEYPFGWVRFTSVYSVADGILRHRLSAALAYKLGYPDVEAYKNDSHKFSIVTSGLVTKPCARLLCINVSPNC
jgi:pimeloyl-ACP methyl ester carboxylesterase